MEVATNRIQRPDRRAVIRGIWQQEWLHRQCPAPRHDLQSGL